MANRADTSAVATATAALAVCESLLLALTDLKVIPAKEAADVLCDAAAAHRNNPDDVALHNQVAAIIEEMAAARSFVVRPEHKP